MEQMNTPAQIDQFRQECVNEYGIAIVGVRMDGSEGYCYTTSTMTNHEGRPVELVIDFDGEEDMQYKKRVFNLIHQRWVKDPTLLQHHHSLVVQDQDVDPPVEKVRYTFHEVVLDENKEYYHTRDPLTPDRQDPVVLWVDIVVDTYLTGE